VPRIENHAVACDVARAQIEELELRQVAAFELAMESTARAG
jgi:hypothetical protein